MKITRLPENTLGDLYPLDTFKLSSGQCHKRVFIKARLSSRLAVAPFVPGRGESHTLVLDTSNGVMGEMLSSTLVIKVESELTING